MLPATRDVACRNGAAARATRTGRRPERARGPTSPASSTQRTTTGPPIHIPCGPQMTVAAVTPAAAAPRLQMARRTPRAEVPASPVRRSASAAAPAKPSSARIRALESLIFSTAESVAVRPAATRRSRTKAVVSPAISAMALASYNSEVGRRETRPLDPFLALAEQFPNDIAGRQPLGLAIEVDDDAVGEDR